MRIRGVLKALCDRHAGCRLSLGWADGAPIIINRRPRDVDFLCTSHICFNNMPQLFLRVLPLTLQHIVLVRCSAFPETTTGRWLHFKHVFLFSYFKIFCGISAVTATKIWACIGFIEDPCTRLDVVRFRAACMGTGLYPTCNLWASAHCCGPCQPSPGVCTVVCILFRFSTY